MIYSMLPCWAGQSWGAVGLVVIKQGKCVLGNTTFVEAVCVGDGFTAWAQAVLLVSSSWIRKMKAECLLCTGQETLSGPWKDKKVL